MINEMKKLKMLEEIRGMKMPLPNFFYVERYGRTAEEQMKDLLTGIGKKEWFLFKTDVRNKEGGLLHNFVMELEKYAKLGKEYDECVLIELSDEIHLEDEFEEFVEYLKSLENRIYFLFTMKQSKNTAFVQECMEQYFFVRVIEAKEYSVQEQLEEIKNACGEYQYEITKDAETAFRMTLEKKEWKAEEQVLCRLRNGVRSMVYERMLESDMSDYKGSTNTKETEISKNDAVMTVGSFTSQMAKKMLSKLESDNKKRAVIGFNQGGLLYE